MTRKMQIFIHFESQQYETLLLLLTKQSKNKISRLKTYTKNHKPLFYKTFNYIGKFIAY